MMRCTTVETPLGVMLLVASEAGVAGAYFEGQKCVPREAGPWREDPGDSLLIRARRQLDEYFGGRRTVFDLPLDLGGTAFQRRVWEALLEIPYGAIETYGCLAARVGAPKAARAVGAAVGRNPLSLIVPCHRVVGRDGALTGYAGGLDRKRALLAREGAVGVCG